jgi:hypothetical protein
MQERQVPGVMSDTVNRELLKFKAVEYEMRRVLLYASVIPGKPCTAYELRLGN